MNKTALKEWSDKDNERSITYQTKRIGGTDHHPQFISTVIVEFNSACQRLFTGRQRASKIFAENDAANRALVYINTQPEHVVPTVALDCSTRSEKTPRLVSPRSTSRHAFASRNITADPVISPNHDDYEPGGYIETGESPSPPPSYFPRIAVQPMFSVPEEEQKGRIAILIDVENIAMTNFVELYRKPFGRSILWFAFGHIGHSQISICKRQFKNVTVMTIDSYMKNATDILMIMVAISKFEPDDDVIIVTGDKFGACCHDVYQKQDSLTGPRSIRHAASVSHLAYLLQMGA